MSVQRVRYRRCKVEDGGFKISIKPAQLPLSHEASLLIANGAKAATPNFNDEKPFELAQDLVVRVLLFEATNPETR